MAITWTDRPARGEGDANYRLVRVGRSGSVRGIILSTNVLGTGTHYWKGRSAPCGGSKCEACKEGQSPRWYGYLALWNPRTDHIAIAEITDGCADDVDRYRAKHGTLRGAEITLHRQGAKPNGRILAEIKQGMMGENRLPDCPEITRIMMKIWGLNEHHEVQERVNRLIGKSTTPSNGKQASNGSK